MLRNVIQFISCILVYLMAGVFPCSAQGAPVDIQLSPKEGTIADAFVLTISFPNTSLANVSKPSFPETPDFAVRLEAEGSRTNIVNGYSVNTATLTYRIYPSQSLKPGSYSLPDFEITIQGKKYPVIGPKIKIIASSNKQNDDEDVSFRQIVDTTKPYVGQQITYRAKLLTGARFVRGDLGEIDIPSVLREDLGKQKQRTKQIGNKFLTLVSEAIIPTKTGKVVIPPRNLTAVLRNQTVSRRRSVFDFDPFDSLTHLRSRQAFKKLITADALTLDVRPLPKAPEGVSGYIPVGSLKVTTELSEVDVAVGESVSLHIELRGKANLRPYELPSPLAETSGFKTYFDQPKLNTSVQGDKILYQKRFSIALIPNTPGELVVPQFSITSFDPYRSKYVTVLTEAKKINATGEPLTEIDIDEKLNRESEEVLGEGLYPQHEGPQLYLSQRIISKQRMYLLIFLVPFLLILLRIFILKHYSGKDPKHLLKAAAYQNALSSLEKENLNVDELWTILSQFLEERIPENKTKLEADSITSFLKDTKAKTATISASSELLNSLTQRRYSGQATSVMDKNEINKMKDLIKNIDEEIG